MTAATPGQAGDVPSLAIEAVDLAEHIAIVVNAPDAHDRVNELRDRLTAAIAAQEPQPAPGDTSAIVDGAVKEWLDRRTATALATAPGIDDREQGKRQGIEQLRYLHLDDYWYVLTPAILAALSKQPQPAPELAALADTWQAKYREYADASMENAAEPDYARAQRAIGVAYKKCAEQLRTAVSAPAPPTGPAPEMAAAMTALAREWVESAEHDEVRVRPTVISDARARTLRECADELRKRTGLPA